MSGPIAPLTPVADLDRRFYAFAIDRAIAWGIDAAAAVVLVQVLIEPGHLWAGVAAIVGVVILVGAVFAVRARPDRHARRAWRSSAIRVVREGSGTPIGVRAALLRQLILGVAALPTLGLGVATLAWTAVMDPDGRRRGWHDHVAALGRGRRPPGARRGARAGRRPPPRRQPDRAPPGPGPRAGDAPARARGPLAAARRPPADRPRRAPPAALVGAAHGRSARAAPPTARHAAPAAPPPAAPGSSSATRCVPEPRPDADPPAAPGGGAHAAAVRADRWRVSFDTGESFLRRGARAGRPPTGGAQRRAGPCTWWSCPPPTCRCRRPTRSSRSPPTVRWS